MRRRFPLPAGLLPFALAAAATAQSVLVPAAGNGQDLTGASAFPFDTLAMRIQYVVDASHFSNAGIHVPITLTGLRIRANAATTQAWAGDTIANLRLDLSTAPVDHLAIGAVFDQNHGTDRTNVHAGAQTIAAGTTQAGVPGPFHVDVVFTSPFVYDQALGDLVVDFRSSGVPDLGNTPGCDATSVPGEAAARRVYALGDPDAASGIVPAGEFSLVFEFVYAPASGLRAAFAATPTRGGSPLLVQFTDASFTSDPGGLRSWAWDFDGDHLVDSTLQHPAFTYGNCGTYDVSLTVTDATNPAVTETKAACVVTDVVQPAFATSYLGNAAVQFTDVSVPLPDSWAWDFDGDGLFDSTGQNPVWHFGPGCTPLAVTLRTGRRCRAPVAVTRLVVPTAGLGTTFVSDSIGTNGWGYFFDVTVGNAFGIEVCGLDTNVNSTGTSFRTDLYVTAGSWIGRDGDPTAWRLVTSGSGTGAGPDQQSFVQLARPLYLPQGSYGLAVYYAGAAPRHSLGNGQNQQFQNGDLTLDLGAARSGLFIGQAFAPRVWNGRLHYRTCGSDGEGSYGFLAPGCAGSLGVPANVAATDCRLGTTLRVDLTGLPQSATFFLLGWSRALSTFGTLPFDLAVFGAPGCLARVSADSTELLVGSAGIATWQLPIPNDPTLLCAQFYTQGLALDAAANALGAVMSDAAAAVIGQ